MVVNVFSVDYNIIDNSTVINIDEHFVENLI